ncbi:MAG: FHA domain-containing protein [Proteobacteria bacterium]|nr:FHA domain-containing protein [Pseudomonadota bacterium]
MPQLATHLNDAGITLLNDQGIVYREPGFAILNDDHLTTGNAAFGQARINPRRIQHRYWSALESTPLTDKRFNHLSAADLVSRQLEQMWATAGDAERQLIVAVPAYMDAGNLGLLLGVAGELGLSFVTLVDAAVAATRREYKDAVLVHIDISLHQSMLSRMVQAGQSQVERTEVLQDCGVNALYNAWIKTLAETFVQQSRFDPLHTAETEQILFNKLGKWLALAATDDVVELEIEFAGIRHCAEIESLSLIAAAAPYYQMIVSKLRALYRADEVPAIQITDRVARLPGLADMLRARVGGEVFALEPGATARGALARCRDRPAAESGASLLRRLPWDQAAFTLEQAEVDQTPANVPTHLLHKNTAYAIDPLPLVVGSQSADSDRCVRLGGDMPGISRRHCSVSRVGQQCIVEDHSRYGTFVNGHRISGSTVLQVGDSLRVGSPGYEFQLITTDEDHGA